MQVKRSLETPASVFKKTHDFVGNWRGRHKILYCYQR